MENGSSPQLLIVDDEPAILLSYATILQQKGYGVTTAAESKSAFALLEGRAFDLLICDLGLEQPFAGMLVVAWARENRPDMPCVLLTGYLDDDISEKARSNGVQTLFKPIEVTKLLETIDFLLRRRRAG